MALTPAQLSLLTRGTMHVLPTTGVPAPAPPPPPILVSPPKASTPVRIAPISGISRLPPVPTSAPPIRIAGTPTLTAPQAISIAQGNANGDPAAAGFVNDTIGAAAAGDPSAIGNQNLLSLADAVHVSASFVSKWFGQAQANTLLAMAHLAG